ncbi:MAG: thioredoxin related protein, partial [Verrucomicrobiales bacterium]|nr:thioredoxin related protein [Verrucomicrobiales bacterium]
MNFSLYLRTFLTVLFSTASIVVAVAGPAPAVLAGGKLEPAKQIDPKADALAGKIGGYFGALRTAQVDIDSIMTVQAKEMKQELPSKYIFSVQRPSQFALRLSDGAMGMDIISDGKQMTTYVPMVKKYTTTNSPAQISASGSIGGPGFGPAPGNSMAFIGALFETNAYEKMMEGVVQGTYLGVEELNGKPTEHVRFSQPDFSWELWAEAGDQPLIKRIVVDMSPMMTRLGSDSKEVPEGMQEMFKDMKVLMRMNFSNWKINAPITIETFQFTPPAGAEKVASLLDLADADDDAKEEPSPLLGKAAPLFQLKTLKGATFDLASEKGNHVVILDFWATWCGPCVKALPVLIDIANSYRDKGVAFYAIDQQEETGVVQ